MIAYGTLILLYPIATRPAYNKAAATAKIPAPTPATLCAAAFGVEVGALEDEVTAFAAELRTELTELTALFVAEPVVDGAEVMEPVVAADVPVVAVVADAEGVADADAQTTAVGSPVTLATLRQNSAAAIGALARSAELHFEVRQHAILARKPPALQIPNDMVDQRVNAPKHEASRKLRAMCASIADQDLHAGSLN